MEKQLLFQQFKKAGFKVGLLSTVKILVDNKEYKATHTTPDSLTINRYLSMMNAEGIEFCFMEVSSHGIHQNRTEGLKFEGGIFTNLTHDHLDYHNTFAEYRDVKNPSSTICQKKRSHWSISMIKMVWSCCKTQGLESLLMH